MSDAAAREPCHDVLVVGAGRRGRAAACRAAAKGFVPLVLDRDPLALGRVLPASAERSVVLLERRGVVPWPPSVPDGVATALVRARALWRGRISALRRPPTGHGVAETAAAFVRRHLGRRAVATLLQPLLAARGGWDAHRVGAAETLPTLLVASAAGRALLPALLAAGRRLGRALPPGLLPPGAETIEGADISVVLPGAPAEVWARDGRRWRAHRVVLAVPPLEAGRLLEDTAPHIADRLGALDTAPVVRVEWPWAWPRAEPGGRGLVGLPGRGARPGLRSWRVETRPSTGTAVAWLGGTLDPGAEDLPAALLARIARRDLGRLGVEPPPQAPRIERRMLTMPSPGRRGLWARLQAELADGGVHLADAAPEGPRDSAAL